MVHLDRVFFSEDDGVVLPLSTVVALHHQRGADGGILCMASQGLPCFVTCPSRWASKDHAHTFAHFLFSLASPPRLIIMVPFRMANIVAKFPTLNELLNFILELEAVGGVMPMILMVMAVPIAIATLGIGL